MLEISNCGYNNVLSLDQEVVLFMDLDYGAIEHKKDCTNHVRFCLQEQYIQSYRHCHRRRLVIV
jgi:hypothetical protein